MNRRAAGLLFMLAGLVVWKRREIEQGGQIIVYEVAKLVARGIRNNNPGNIRKNGTGWHGLAPADQQTDAAFFVFVSPEYGIRALAKLLVNYQQFYGLDTVRGLINRYAPPVENDTGAYVEAVAAAVGVGPDEPISVAANIRPLVEAIIAHENGLQPYPAEIITAGINLAGVA